MEKDIAVLILSCDKYSDVWKPFFGLFRKYWPACPYPVYLGSNEIDPQIPGVKTIRSGKAMDWSNDTKKILEQIPEKYLIVLLEDYFLIDQVDQPWLEKCLELMRGKDAFFMRIASFRNDHFPMYPFDVLKKNPEFGINRKDSPYRINLQAAIWNKNDFQELIKPGESPWEFEINGSVRSNTSAKPFLCITASSGTDKIVGPVSYLCTAITKGTWMREAISLCKKEKIDLDLNLRPIESIFGYIRRKTYHALPFKTRGYIDFISSRFTNAKK